MSVRGVQCCNCGVPMTPNDANMCLNCVRSEVDITEGLQKQIQIIQCPCCSSYLQPPRTWVNLQWESEQLSTFCIKRLKNLNTVKLLNAEFVHTEPNSKMIKLKLNVEKEVLNEAVLEQSFVVEYTIKDQICDSCSRILVNPDHWVACVQLRQYDVPHRQTFLYLEQVILKYNAASDATRIRQVNRGIDLFFENRSHALSFVKFLRKFVPLEYRDDKELIFRDPRSNINDYRYTFSVEICPICRDDLICLPQKVAMSLGNLGPLVICTKVSDRITLLDPFTLRYAVLDSEQYWRSRFKSLLTSRQLDKYIVFDVEPRLSEVTIGGTHYAQCYTHVARESDVGRIFYVRTHLGEVLKPGDHALGYDLNKANVNNSELENYSMNVALPDVILIKKDYEELREKRSDKSRPWMLKGLPMEVDDCRGRADQEEKIEKEYEEFLRDLEENPELRSNVCFYRNKDYQSSETTSMADEEGLPSVPFKDLLANLDLDEEDEK